MNRSAAFGLVLAAAVLVAACLPSGTRGHDPAAPSGSVPATSTPVPSPSGPAPSRTIVPPTPTPVPTFFIYTVKTGDNLNSIARLFGTTARSIAFWNRETYPSLDPTSPKYKPDRLDIGWTLFLIPNDVVDEQDLPDPSADAGASDGPVETPEPDPTDPATGPDASDSAGLPDVPAGSGEAPLDPSDTAIPE